MAGFRRKRLVTRRIRARRGPEARLSAQGQTAARPRWAFIGLLAGGSGNGLPTDSVASGATEKGWLADRPDGARWELSGAAPPTDALHHRSQLPVGPPCRLVYRPNDSAHAQLQLVHRPQGPPMMKWVPSERANQVVIGAESPNTNLDVSEHRAPPIA